VDNEILEALKQYFFGRMMLPLLSSSAHLKGKARIEGDIDIAVYFWPENDIEWQNVNKRYARENRIALDLEKLLKKEVDLIISKQGKGNSADEAIRKREAPDCERLGTFSGFLCHITDEENRMREWIETSYRDRHVATGR